MPAVQQEPFQRVDADEAKRLIDGGIQIIDVREPAELRRDGMISNSTLVPLNTLLANARSHLKEDNLLFMCKVGQRSAIACEMAAAVGFTKLYNLEGGIDSWKKKGLPVEYPS